MVHEQVIAKDPDLRLDQWRERFSEVKNELLPDIRAIDDRRTITNRHKGIVNTLIPQRAQAYARTWQEKYADYLLV
jgi:hypothetical protein